MSKYSISLFNATTHSIYVYSLDICNWNSIVFRSHYKLWSHW